MKPFVEKVEHYDPTTPNVDLLSVREGRLSNTIGGEIRTYFGVSSREEELWSHVEQSTALLSESSVRPEGEGRAQTEVSDLNSVQVVHVTDQDVLLYGKGLELEEVCLAAACLLTWLEISVNDVLGVKVRDTLEYSLHYRSDFSFCKLLILLISMLDKLRERATLN